GNATPWLPWRVRIDSLRLVIYAAFPMLASVSPCVIRVDARGVTGIPASAAYGEYWLTFSVMPALQDQRGIDAAERKIVGHRAFDLELPRQVHDVIQRTAAHIDLREIDIGCEPAFTHHFDRHPGLQRTACAERMAHIALERADRHAVAENGMGGSRFG